MAASSTYVVMDDQVHALLRPIPPYELQAILHSWKSFTAREMPRRHTRLGRVWQDKYFDRIIRDDQEFTQKRNCIAGNPWKRWPDLGEYAWVWPLDS